jgi:hypothetical protein
VFVQPTKSTRNGKTYVTHQVRESFRTPKGPRSRTICNLSDLPKEVRELIAASLRGEPMVPVHDLKLAEAQDYGGLAVLVDAWRRLGLDRFMSGLGTPRQQGLLKAMILGRILFPSAKLALCEQAEGTALARACGLSASGDFDGDDLCEAMDLLNGQWVPMEKNLYQEAFPQGVRMVLYDLTSTCFEGCGPDKMGRYGHSRDHREGRQQIILAVATDPDGIPLHVEVLRGNRADNKTLQGLLATLRRRFGIREATFVFDGGMSSTVNLEALDEAQMRFVTRLSNSTMESLLAELPQEKPLELGDRTRLVEGIHQGKRHVIAGGDWRCKRDEERRSARRAKGRSALEKMARVKRKQADPQKLASQAGRMLERLKAHKYFTCRVNPQGVLEWAEKKETIQKEIQRDGWYLLHPNCPAETCDKEKVLAHYKGLLKVEEAFCQLKSYMEVRPIYHWRPDRVRNHVRLCFIAYWLSARLGREWRNSGESGEGPRILRRLQSIRIGKLEVAGKMARSLMTETPQELNKLLEKLNVIKLFATVPDWAV